MVPGSMLALDAQGRLILCEHGNRRITRLERDGSRTVLADRYQGRRLNSPNDVSISSKGHLYFTDPPFGLPGSFDDPHKEQTFTGVYRLEKQGDPQLLIDDLRCANGVALSPDEKTLYVANAEAGNPVWMAYDLDERGRLTGKSRVFFDARPWVGKHPGLPDGLKVDRKGHLFASGPGGIYVFTPAGEYLGTIVLGVATSNCNFGGSDGQGLFITASTAIYRVRLSPTERPAAR